MVLILVGSLGLCLLVVFWRVCLLCMVLSVVLWFSSLLILIVSG